MTFIIYATKKGSPITIDTENWDTTKIADVPYLGTISNGTQMSFIIDEATYQWLEDAKVDSSYEENTLVINMLDLFKGEKLGVKRF